MKSLAVVIGGSSGIGAAILDALQGDYHTICFARNKNPTHNSIFMDVTDEESVKTAFSGLAKAHGTPEIMIYCAGYVEPKGIFEVSEDDVLNTIDTNLTGAVYCTKEFARLNRDSGGKIIYISSTAGSRPQPGWSIYAAAKAALNNFALTMSDELRNYGIKVYCIAPGRCATKLRRKLAPDEDFSKIMQPEEVALFVKKIIEDDGMLDGQVITVRKSI
jgi:NAD(P)-dependent dehydrogenase (short-subunit alcohol dehydrogenase family)